MANVGTLLKVTYWDARTEEVRVGPRGYIATEQRYAASDVPMERQAYERMAYMAWATLKPDVGFDEWIDTLAELDVEKDAEGAATPLPEAPSPEQSPT